MVINKNTKDGSYFPHQVFGLPKFLSFILLNTASKSM